MTFVSGFVALIGPPNVGKSTLLNALLGRKLSIVSPKPQTTRNRILGILNQDDAQIAFLDTPGIHASQTALHRSMVASALAALNEVDLVVLLVEADRPERPEFDLILTNLRKVPRPALLAINKIDKLPRQRLLPVMDRWHRRHPFEALVPVSALTGQGLAALLGEVKKHLTVGPPLFPSDMITDATEALLVAETIREQVYRLTQKEIPYAAAVTVEHMEDVPPQDLLRIHACIHMATPSQKGIVIGRGGSMIKAIGTAARKELEAAWGRKVYLELAVRVEKNWTRDAKALQRLGY